MRVYFFSKKTFEQVLGRHNEYKNINIFIETGTWSGYQTKLATDYFPTVYGIELNDDNVLLTEKSAPKANIIHGDTVEKLPLLFELYKNTPLFIYLDAHFIHVKGQKRVPLPLWKELEFVKQRNITEIVVIDDTHCFGVVRDDLKMDKSVREWEDITKESLLEFFGDRVKDSFEIERSFVIYLMKI